MLKKLLFILCLVCFVPAFAEARISIEADNLTNTISYRSYKNVGAFGIHEYAILKNVDKQENERYFLTLVINFTNHSSAASRYLLGDEIDFSVDGKVFKATKLVNTQIPRTFHRINVLDKCFYSIPNECMKAISGANDVRFTVYVPTKKPDTIIFNNGNLSEVKNMIENGHFRNYLEDINVHNEKYSKEV